MKTAIFSVYNKANIDVLAKFLINKGYTILSSGGTYNHLKKYVQDNNKVKKIEDITGQPEILEGRVKTLHPIIHGGILADLSNNQHCTDLDTYNINKIDLVVVNLYPFERTLEITDDENELIEQIDIGGHTLIRSTAKNYKNNIILFSPSQYNYFIENYDSYIESIELRKKLAKEAFNYITDYDISISNYFFNDESQSVNKKYLSLTKQLDFKYGNNPHQKPSALWTVNETEYKKQQCPFTILNGSLGYINMLDAINSWNLVCEIYSTTQKTAAASFKHTSPAGVSIGREFTDADFLLTNTKPNEYDELSCEARAYILARNVDPKSSFGDFVAVSGNVDISLAKRLQKEVSDGIIALSYTQDALDLLKTKKQGKYVVLQGDIFPEKYNEVKVFGNFAMTQINNSQLTTVDVINDGLVNAYKLLNDKLLDMQIANIILKYAQSNSVSLVQNGTLLGIGCGQQSRIDCVKLACEKALMVYLRYIVYDTLNNNFKPTVKRQDKINATIQYIENDFTESELKEWRDLFNHPPKLLDNNFYKEVRKGMKNITMASDGFFPFYDNIDLANKYGVKYIIQPGGSLRDKEIIDRCNGHRIIMVLSHIRQFHH